MSDSVHRIRLIGPWEWKSAADVNWNRIRLPDEWTKFEPLSGAVQFRRKFHAPTGIDPGDRLFVSVPMMSELEQVSLNGLSLQPHSESVAGSCRYEITSQLQPHNTLELALRWIQTLLPESSLGLPVVLEIDSVRG